MENDTNVVIEKVTNEEAINEEGVIAKKAQSDLLIAELTKELDALQVELDDKKYLIDGGKTIANDFRKFVTNEVKWRFTEALGVIEVTKALDSFIKDQKQKELMLGPLEIEALYYFLSKHEGVGLESAKLCYELIKAINPAKSRKESDSKKFEEISFRIQSLHHGVDPEEIKNRIENNENTDENPE